MSDPVPLDAGATGSKVIEAGLHPLGGMVGCDINPGASIRFYSPSNFAGNVAVYYVLLPPQFKTGDSIKKIATILAKAGASCGFAGEHALMNQNICIVAQPNAANYPGEETIGLLQQLAQTAPG